MQLWNKEKTSVFANSWRRSRVILIEKHFQAVFQENNAYNPFSDESKAIDRESGNVELFELCETIPKVLCSECLLYWNQEIVLRTSLGWKRIHPKFSPMATGCFLNPALRHQKGATSWCSARQNWGRNSSSWPTMRGGDVSKRILMNFTIASNEIQYIVIRNSKLAGPRRSASRWINWHKKTIPVAHPLRSTRDLRKTGTSHWTNQAETHRWNSDQTSEKQPQLWTVSTANLEKSDLNQSLFINTKGGIRLLLPVLHGGSGMKTGGAHIFWICCSKIVYSWLPSAATDGVCEQNTLTRHIFSCFSALITMSHVTLAQGVVRVIPSMCHVPVCLTSLRLSTLHSSQSLSSSTSSSWSSFSPSMWVGSERIPLCAPANPLVENAPLTGYEPKFIDDYHFSRDHWNLHPGVLQRHQALELVWLGDQWPHHQQTALFSNVREHPCRDSDNEQISILLERQKSRFSLIVEHRFRNSSSRPILTENRSQNWMELSSLKQVRLIVLLKETNNFDEIHHFMNNCWHKIGIFVKLMRKVSMRWKNWSDFKALHSIQFQGEIDRRSRHYPWTHKQDSGI